MTTTVGQVRFEHHRESLGIGESQPRISWTVQTDRDGWARAGLRDPGHRARRPGRPMRSPPAGWRRRSRCWCPGRLEPMGSRTRRLVRVRVWGNGGDGPSEWSEPAAVETGLLRSTDWTAQLISPSWPEDTSVDQPPALFRCEFDASADLVSARLYVTAHGVFEVELNGSVVGADVLAPGWSSYRHRLRYHTYDVTELLEPGANAIGATVAEGWYRGLLGFEGGQRNIYRRPARPARPAGDPLRRRPRADREHRRGLARRTLARSSPPASMRARRTTPAGSWPVGLDPGSSPRAGPA